MLAGNEPPSTPALESRHMSQTNGRSSTEMLGLAIATATVNNPAYANAYDVNSVGGLLGQVLFPHLGNFGRFCLVVLALSIIGKKLP